MEPYDEQTFNGNHTEEKTARVKRQVAAGAVALLGITGIALSYGAHERYQVREIAQQAAVAKTTSAQLQAQVNTLTARLNDMAALQASKAVGTPPPAATGTTATDENAEAAAPAINVPSFTSPSSEIATASKPAAPKHVAAKRRPSANDKRYDQLKSQLDDQQKQLKATQDEVAKNRSDLEGSISSTRDELNGSIAKTHDELVTLEKRGERSYFEFDLAKTKQFQRIGPITLSLRKADTKHKNYDLAMIVDDNELSKKKVNLYEPVWIHMEDGGQPVQIVVNHIDKDSVHGYVSAPKYKQSELATLSSSAPSPGAQPAQQPPQQ
jgi:uncharacterized coiled-coil protein SlyX